VSNDFDPHTWRFVVPCGQCEGLIALGDAPSVDMLIEPHFSELRVICPYCGNDGGYQPRQLSRQLQRVNSGSGIYAHR
jgi:hypothetical protein